MRRTLAVRAGSWPLPRALANPVLFLGSEMAAHVTGAALEVHGGGERPPFLEQGQG